MKKIESRNPVLNDIVVPALDELGYGDLRPEKISMSKDDGYGADIVLRLHTDTPNISWLCYVQNPVLGKVLMSCVLTEQHGTTFKVLDKAAYSINVQDLRYVSAEEIDANRFCKLEGDNVE